MIVSMFMVDTNPPQCGRPFPDPDASSHFQITVHPASHKTLCCIHFESCMLPGKNTAIARNNNVEQHFRAKHIER